MLPAAAAAHAEMLATGLNTYITRSDQALDVTLGICFFLFIESYVCHIARSTERNEHDHVVDTGERVAFGCDVSNSHRLKHGQRFAFSCHIIQLDRLTTII